MCLISKYLQERKQIRVGRWLSEHEDPAVHGHPHVPGTPTFGVRQGDPESSLAQIISFLFCRDPDSRQKGWQQYTKTFEILL